MTGRPPLGAIDHSADHQVHTKAERRTVLWSLRLTQLEAEMLAAAAKRAGLAPSQLARARIFGSGDLEARVARIERLLGEEVLNES